MTFFPQFFERKWWRVRVGTPRRGHCCNWELGTPVGFWESSYRRHAWIILRYSVNVRAGVSLSLPFSCKTHSHSHTHFSLTLFGVAQRGTEMSFKCSHYLLLSIISLYKSLIDVSPWCVLVCMCACVCALSRVCLVHKCNAENAGYFWKGGWYVSDWYIFVCVCVGGRGSEWLEKKWGMIFMWQLICFWMQEAQRPLSKGIKHRARGASVTVLSADTHTHAHTGTHTQNNEAGREKDTRPAPSCDQPPCELHLRESGFSFSRKRKQERDDQSHNRWSFSDKEHNEWKKK